MIAVEDQQRLLTALKRMWAGEVVSTRFRDICAGKERGHRIADHTEEQTVAFMQRDGFAVAFEHGSNRAPRARSMGDIWLLSGSPPIFNPINVKAGIAGVSGQPNMVSLEKLTQAIVAHVIDSYWLLFVRVTTSNVDFTASLTLINIFDYLDFMTFDSGPGQIMLRSDLFYAYIEAGGVPMPLTLDETVTRLVDIRRRGDARLLENRRMRLQALEEKVANFDAGLPIDQTKIHLHPAEPQHEHASQP